MKEERILSEEEIEKLLDASIEKGISVFHSIWDEFKDTKEFDIETIVASIMTECAIFLRMREWAKKEIRENMEVGISVADETIAEMKKEEKNA